MSQQLWQQGMKGLGFDSDSTEAIVVTATSNLSNSNESSDLYEMASLRAFALDAEIAAQAVKEEVREAL
jgi:hypothetical protein